MDDKVGESGKKWEKVEYPDKRAPEAGYVVSRTVL